MSAIAAGMLCMPAQAQAAICAWVGGGADAQWSTAANWSACGGVAPQDGDSVVFPAGGAQPANVNDIADLSLASIAVAGVGTGNVRYRITGVGVTVTTTAGVLFDAPADGTSLGPQFLAPITLASPLGITNTGAAPASLGVIAANGFVATFDPANAGIAANAVSGPGSIEKNGAGVLSVTSITSLSPAGVVAAVTINAGTLQTTFLAEATSMTIQAGAVWESLSLHQRTSVIAGSGRIALGDRRLTISGMGPAEFSGEIEGTAVGVNLEALRLDLPADGIFTFSGTGPIGATHVVRGTLMLANPSGDAILGSLRVGQEIGVSATLQATVRLAAANQIAAPSAVEVEDSGLLDLAGHDDAFDSIVTDFPGAVELGSATLTVGRGDIRRISDSGLGGRLVKVSTGYLRLIQQDAVFSGLVVVEDGQFDVFFGAGELDVQVTGGQLRGRGAVGNVVATGGDIAPGTNPGFGNDVAILDRFVSGSVTLGPAVAYLVDMGPGPNPPVTYDQWVVTGTVDLANASLVLSGTPSASPGSAYTILDNDGGDPIAGTFAHLPEGATFDVNGETFMITYRGGTGNDVVIRSAAPLTYLLAEGATGTFFDYDLLIANPNPAAAPITLTFFFEGGGTVVQTRTVPAQSRQTIHVDEIEGLEAAAVSARVTSDTGLPLVVERTMFWDAAHYGGHTVEAVREAAPTWYFAEGSQGFFDTYMLVVNPNPNPTDVTLTFLREGESPVVATQPVAANGRLTLHTASLPELAGRSFGISVQANDPVVAERAMYFGTTPERLWSGGHGSAGVSSRQMEWDLPEGATGTFFQTFLLLANPGDEATNVYITYLGEGGEYYRDQKTIPAAGRLTLNVGDETRNLIPPGGVALRVESLSQPIVAERSMYWAGEQLPWGEAHNTFGLLIDRLTLHRWGLAEGRVGGPLDFRSYVLLANSSPDAAAEVDITFLRENGALPIVKTFTVPARSRFTVDVASMVPELQDESFGAEVRLLNDVPIFVERSMYWNALGAFWAGGTNAAATPIR